VVRAIRGEEVGTLICRQDGQDRQGDENGHDGQEDRDRQGEDNGSEYREDHAD